MLISLENIEHIFRDFAKILKKKNRTNGLSCELIVVGGDSIQFNSIEEAEETLQIKVIPEFAQFNFIEDNVFNVT